MCKSCLPSHAVGMPHPSNHLVLILRACVEVMTVEMQGVRTLCLAPEITCTCLIRPSTCLIGFSVAYSVLPPIFLLISYFSIDSSSIVRIYLLYLLPLLAYSYKPGNVCNYTIINLFNRATRSIVKYLERKIY